MTNSSSMCKQYQGAKPKGTVTTTLHKQHWFTNNKEFLETAAWVRSKALFTLVKLLRKSLQKADHFCTTKCFWKQELIHPKGFTQETPAAVTLKWSVIKPVSAMMHATSVQPLPGGAVSPWGIAPCVLALRKVKASLGVCSGTKGDMMLELAFVPCLTMKQVLCQHSSKSCVYVGTPRLLENQHFTVGCALRNLIASDVIGSSHRNVTYS